MYDLPNGIYDRKVSSKNNQTYGFVPPLREFRNKSSKWIHFKYANQPIYYGQIVLKML